MRVLLHGCLFFLFLSAVASKAPRKQLGGGSGGGSSSMYSNSSSSNNPNFGLCNHAKMWPTPTWQKGRIEFNNAMNMIIFTIEPPILDPRQFGRMGPKDHSR